MKKRNENSCGIYALTFGDKVIYIGQSNQIEKRVKDHMRWKSQLKEILNKFFERGKLTDGELIAYRRYSFIAEHEGEIEWKVLELCDEYDLDRNEEYWINKYKPQFNYEGVYDEYRGQRHKRGWNDEAEECAW